MNLDELTRAQAKVAMEEWIRNYPSLPAVDPSWEKIRAAIQQHFYSLFEEGIKDNYYIDVKMGVYVFQLFEQEHFTMRMASDDAFWRFVSLKVVPDIVGRRWGYKAADHYWLKPSRNWMRSVWWYVYLSLHNNNLQATEKVLLSPHFNTDTILNLEERTGRKGTYVEVYKYIMYFYSMIPDDTLKDLNDRLKEKDKHASLFRTIMKLNTARTMSIDPSLYLGGPMEYVKSLYRETGVNL